MAELRVHGLTYNVWLVVMALQVISPVSAQEAAGARGRGMGGITLALEGPFSSVNNPATLGQVRQVTTGITHAQHFLLKELRTTYLGLGLPVGSGAMGMVLGQTGIPDMKHYQVGLSYGRAFGHSVSAGLTLHYVLLTVSGEEQRHLHFGSFSAGMQFRATDDWVFGLYVFNPLSGLRIFDDQLLMPSIFRVGFLYEMNDHARLSAETSKSTGLPPDLRIGMEYSMLSSVAIRTGISINPFTWSFGAGLVLGGLYLDISSTLHPALGITPELTISYLFDRHAR